MWESAEILWYAISLLGRRSALQPEIVEGRRVRKGGDQRQCRLVDPRAHSVQEGILPYRGEDDTVGQDALDLPQHFLALLPVQLAGLALEQILDLGDHTGGVESALRG